MSSFDFLTSGADPLLDGMAMPPFLSQADADTQKCNESPGGAHPLGNAVGLADFNDARLVQQFLMGAPASSPHLSPPIVVPDTATTSAELTSADSGTHDHETAACAGAGADAGIAAAATHGPTPASTAAAAAGGPHGAPPHPADGWSSSSSSSSGAAAPAQLTPPPPLSTRSSASSIMTSPMSLPPHTGHPAQTAGGLMSGSGSGSADSHGSLNAGSAGAAPFSHTPLHMLQMLDASSVQHAAAAVAAAAAATAGGSPTCASSPTLHADLGQDAQGLVADAMAFSGGAEGAGQRGQVSSEMLHRRARARSDPFGGPLFDASAMGLSLGPPGEPSSPPAVSMAMTMNLMGMQPSAYAALRMPTAIEEWLTPTSATMGAGASPFAIMSPTGPAAAGSASVSAASSPHVGLFAAANANASANVNSSTDTFMSSAPGTACASTPLAATPSLMAAPSAHGQAAVKAEAGAPDASAPAVTAAAMSTTGESSYDALNLSLPPKHHARSASGSGMSGAMMGSVWSQRRIPTPIATLPAAWSSPLPTGSDGREGVAFWSDVKLFTHLHAITSSLNDGQPVLVVPFIQSLVDRGFFLQEGVWTCYRRNYFGISSSINLVAPAVSLPGGMSDANVLALAAHVLNGDAPESMDGRFRSVPLQDCYAMDRETGRMRRVSDLVISVSSENTDSPELVPLVQHTAKRDKGPQFTPPNWRLECGARLAAGHHHPFGDNRVTSTMLGPMSSQGSGGGFLDLGNGVVDPLTGRMAEVTVYERLQFKTATAHATSAVSLPYANAPAGMSTHFHENGMPRQQYYRLALDIFLRFEEDVPATPHDPKLGRGVSVAHIVGVPDASSMLAAASVPTTFASGAAAVAASAANTVPLTIDSATLTPYCRLLSGPIIVRGRSPSHYADKTAIARADASFGVRSKPRPHARRPRAMSASHILAPTHGGHGGHVKMALPSYVPPAQAPLPNGASVSNFLLAPKTNPHAFKTTPVRRRAASFAIPAAMMPTSLDRMMQSSPAFGSLMQQSEPRPPLFGTLGGGGNPSGRAPSALMPMDMDRLFAMSQTHDPQNHLMPSLAAMGRRHSVQHPTMEGLLGSHHGAGAGASGHVSSLAMPTSSTGLSLASPVAFTMPLGASNPFGNLMPASRTMNSSSNQQQQQQHHVSLYGDVNGTPGAMPPVTPVASTVIALNAWGF